VSSRQKLRTTDISPLFTLHAEVLADDVRAAFERRVKAVKMVHSGKTGHDVYQACGISDGEQTRLIKRFLDVDDAGVCWGDRALLPSARLKKYERRAPFKTNAVTAKRWRKRYAWAYAQKLPTSRKRN
jgi:hypothetical protein